MRYRHLWPGMTLLATLMALLAGLVIWGNQLLSPTPSGGIRRLLQGWPAAQEAPAPGGADLTASQPPLLQADESGGAARINPRGGAEPAPSAASRETVHEPAKPVAPRPAPTSTPRYALQIGVFVTAEEADIVETKLSQAGLSTIRFRHQAAANLYGVLVEPIGSPEEAAAIVGRLRSSGMPEGAVLTGNEGLTVKVGESMPLRAAVTLAGRLRAAGLEVRIAAQPGLGSEITLRHGNFASRAEAQRASEAVARLGVPNAVVRVR
jgi:cell division septation protein DedD